MASQNYVTKIGSLEANTCINNNMILNVRRTREKKSEQNPCTLVKRSLSERLSCKTAIHFRIESKL